MEEKIHTCNFNLLISVRTREIISLKVTNKIKKKSGICFLLSDIHTLNVTYILWILLYTLSKWISSGLSPSWSFIALKFEFHSRPLNPTRSKNCQFLDFFTQRTCPFSSWTDSPLNTKNDSGGAKHSFFTPRNLN